MWKEEGRKEKTEESAKGVFIYPWAINLIFTSMVVKQTGYK